MPLLAEYVGGKGAGKRVLHVLESDRTSILYLARSLNWTYAPSLAVL